VTRKYALVVGVTDYQDHRLTQLVSPQADVAALAEALSSSDLGQFDEVRTLVNEPHQRLTREMWRFLGGDRRADDFVLVYYSGHGVKDENGKLYLACPDTDTGLLRATALLASELTEALDQCRARRQVLILDCCNSGAFRRGTKGVRGESVGTSAAFTGSTAFRGEGQGRVVLTATDSTQYAMEGDSVDGEAQRSVFTRHLLEGLRTGEADQNGDGWIGVDELYDYVHYHVVSETPRQQPCKFADDVRGEFVIARRPRGTEKAVPLPADLEDDLRSISVATRLDAVNELGVWLSGGHIGRVLAAVGALERVAAEDDSMRVRTAAQGLLDSEREAYERALSERPEKVTLLAASERRSGRAPGRPGPGATGAGEAGPVAAAAPAAPAEPAGRAQPDERTRAAWREWAAREFPGDAALSGPAAEAAIAALAAGATPDAAAAAARELVASRRPAQPAGPAPVPGPPPAPGWQPARQPDPPPPVRPAPVPPPPGGAVPVPPARTGSRPTPAEATAALVLGIVGLLGCGLVAGPIAIWLAVRARQRIATSGGQLGGAGLATAGLWLGIVSLVLFFVYLVWIGSLNGTA
jgi:hypothetical protein